MNSPHPVVDQLDQWLTEIAPLIDAAQLRRHGDTTWLIDLDEFTGLVVFLEEAAQKLVFTTAVGTPIPDDRLDTYELLLLVNALWSQTGGLRLALDGPDGAVQVIFELPLHGLEKDLLLTRLEGFIAAGNNWRTLIAAKRTEHFDPVAALEAGEMLRV